MQSLKERAVKLYESKEAEFPDPEQIREVERVILLKVIDRKWMDHIDDMDQLRQGIGLQSLGQKDPLLEYKFQGFDMFDSMTDAIMEDTIRSLMHVKIEQRVEREEVAKVTGTNKDDSAKRVLSRERERRFSQTTRVLAAPEGSISSAAEEDRLKRKNKDKQFTL